MFDKIVDIFGKAVESTMRLQQEMLQKWAMECSPQVTQASELPLTGTSTSASETPAAAWLEQVSTVQSKSAEAVTEMLKRHRETLDEQYRAGILAIDDAFRVGQARDPEHFRRLSEELWRRNCEVLGTAVASQMHDVQSVMEKWYEAARLAAARTKV